MRGDLHRAKMRALETRRQCRVTFSANGYIIDDGDQGRNSINWGNIDANGAFTPAVSWRSKDLNQYPQITLTNGGAAIVVGSEPFVTFSPRGTAMAGSIQVEHPTRGNLQVVVNNVGRIDVRGW
jgi:hypothetical protein